MPWNDNSGNGDEPPKANGGPWGSGGSGGNGNGDGGSPWGRPGGGGGQGGGSDIEDQMRKMQERFSRRGRGGGGCPGGLAKRSCISQPRNPPRNQRVRAVFDDSAQRLSAAGGFRLPWAVGGRAEEGRL